MKLQTFKSIACFFISHNYGTRIEKVVSMRVDGDKPAIKITGDGNTYLLYRDGSSLIYRKCHRKRSAHSDKVLGDLKDLYPKWKESFCKKWMCLANQLRGAGMEASPAMKKAHSELMEKPHLQYIRFQKARNGKGTGVYTGRIIDPLKKWTDYQQPKGTGRKLKQDQVLKIDHFKVMVNKYPLISYYTYLVVDKAA